MSFLHSLKDGRRAMYKEIFVYFLMLIVIIALAFSIWFFQRQTEDLLDEASNLEAQLNDPRKLMYNALYNVTITNVSSTSWGNPVGMALSKQFSITIENTGVRDVGGLTNEFKILENGNVTDNYGFSVGVYSPMQLGVLHVQESAVIVVDVLTSWDVSRAGKSLVVTFMLDEAVMDEYKLSLAAWEGF